MLILWDWGLHSLRQATFPALPCPHPCSCPRVDKSSVCQPPHCWYVGIWGWTILCWWGGSCAQQDISEHLYSLAMRCQELSMSGFDNQKCPLANDPGRVENPHPQLSPTGLQSPFSAKNGTANFPQFSFLKSPQAPFLYSWSVSKPLSVFQFLSFASHSGGESWEVFTLPPHSFVPQTFFGCCLSQCAWNTKNNWEEKDTVSAPKEFKFTG